MLFIKYLIIYVIVWAPPGDLLGRVKETFSLFNAEFVIEDSHGNIIYQIEGPPKLMCFCRLHELHLKVLSPDYVSQQGSITRIWNTDISAYTQNVYFAETNLDVKLKALFLGAAVLMVLQHYIKLMSVVQFSILSGIYVLSIKMFMLLIEIDDCLS